MSDFPHSQDGISAAMRDARPATIKTVMMTEAEQVAYASGWNRAIEAAAKVTKETAKECDHFGLSQFIPVIDRTVDAISALSMPAPTRQEAGWQPIETAPKDGTSVILFCRVHGVMEGIYDNGAPGWTDPIEAAMMLFPTHWMALTSPPQPTEGGE